MDHRLKTNESEKDKYLDLAREHKTMEHEGDGDISCGLSNRNKLQWIGKATGRLGNKETSEDHPAYSIIKIGQITEKSPGDLRRLAVTQTPVRIDGVKNPLQ